MCYFPLSLVFGGGGTLMFAPSLTICFCVPVVGSLSGAPSFTLPRKPSFPSLLFAIRSASLLWCWLGRPLYLLCLGCRNWELNICSPLNVSTLLKFVEFAAVG